MSCEKIHRFFPGKLAYREGVAPGFFVNIEAL